jgi:hypothetical protein
MTQIVRKFVQDNAISGAKIRLDNNENLRARNSANSADIDILRVTTGNVTEFQSLPTVNSTLPVPTTDKQLATVEYIKNYVNGKLDAKDSVAYLADTNITGTFVAGNSTTPATLTGNTQLVIDGKSFTGTDITTPRVRIALTGQTAGLQNGIYDLTAATGASYTLTRSSDFDGLNSTGLDATEVTSGAYFTVVNGTVYSGYEVILTTVDPITINTTALSFVKYPSTLSLTGGDMIVKSGNDFAVDLQANGGLESSNPGNQAGQLRIKVDTSSLEKDKTTAINTSTGAIVARKHNKQTFTLSAQDITNQYIDLSFIAGDGSVNFAVQGGGAQLEGVDYTVNYTGGTGGKSRLTFTNGLATAGVSALASGDVIQTQYTYLIL